MSLIPVEEAQARLLALATPLPGENMPAALCAGRWLQHDILSLRDQPWADLSAMDGYAVRASEWPGPWTIAGTSAAGGEAPAPLEPGAACRIFTGAPLPDGADAVLIQENARLEGGALAALGEALPPARHVRPAGSDFRQGDILLPAGALLGPARIALAVLAGHGDLPVGGKPRIALLSTGDELTPPGAPTPPGRLPGSNGPMLAAMLAALPCEITDMGIIGDDLAAQTDAFARAAGADIIISTGGASVGDHDLVRPALLAAGGTLDFWKIRMRPGKPLMAGTIGNAIFLGLPGNPVSAFVTATLFLLPLIRHMAGASDPKPRTTKAVLGSALPATGERDEYLRAFQSDLGVVSVTSQDSAAVASLAAADCLIQRPAGSPQAKAGDGVTILPFTP